MISSPDSSTLHALANLESNSDWKTVQLWLVNELVKQDMNNRVTTSDTVMHQGQGAAQTLAKIIDSAKNARDLVKAKSTPTQRHPNTLLPGRL